jgi:hypothetical protein
VLRKEITYKNPFDGEEVTETHYFHLTEADIVELDMVHKDGLIAHLITGIANEDKAVVFTQLKEMILKAYGKRVGNNKFVKNDQVCEEFLSTDAYSALFVSLLRDTNALSAFVNGIAGGTMTTTSLRAVPDSDEMRKVYSSDIGNLTHEEMIQLGEDIAAGKVMLVPGEAPEKKKEYTRKELTEMSPEDYERANEEIESGRAKLNLDPST